MDSKQLQALYLSIDGRISRQTYWLYCFLPFILALIITSIVDQALGLTFGRGGQSGGMLRSIATVLLIWPSIATAAKRMHDIGKSGWWQLINLIPLIGAIIFIVLCCQKSDSGPNKYGAPPSA